MCNERTHTPRILYGFMCANVSGVSEPTLWAKVGSCEIREKLASGFPAESQPDEVDRRSHAEQQPP
jgi:Zn ribbon nucleic-acid-binding protein